MPLTIPQYIQSAGVAAEPLDHAWNRSIQEDVLLDQPALKRRLSAISSRGTLAFLLGSIEWVLWRLGAHFPDRAPFQLVEAGWAGIIDWRYLSNLQPPGWVDDVPLNVGGPVDQALWLLGESFVAAREGQPFWGSAASASEIVLRVIHRPDVFKQWRRFAILRLRDTHPRPDNELLGTPVPRKALDPAFDYDPRHATPLLADFLKRLEPSKNSYLRSPAQMIDAGFSGTPYSL